MSLPTFESTPEPPVEHNRMSIVSITSAEYFSAESLDGGSKNNSVSSSPDDFRSGKGALISVSPIPPIAEEDRLNGRSLEGPSSQKFGGQSDGHHPSVSEDMRVNSSLSLDDESFNTPPSSPCLSTTPSPHPPSDPISLVEVYNAAGEYLLSSTATLKAGLKLSKEERAAMTACILRESDSAGGVEEEKTAMSNSTGSGSITALKNGSSTETTNDVKKEVEIDKARVNVDVEKEEAEGLSHRVNCDSGPQGAKLNGSAEAQTEEWDGGSVTINVVERSETGSRSEDADSVFSGGGGDGADTATPTPTTITDATVPVAPRRIKRRRSSTMSNTSSDTLPTRASKNKWKQKTNNPDRIVSKDDNFDTEHRVQSGGMVSAFSEKDYEDIFNKVFIKKDSKGSPENKKEAENNGQEGGEVCNLETEGRTNEPEVCLEESGEMGVAAGEDLAGWTIVVPDSIHPNRVRGYSKCLGFRGKEVEKWEVGEMEYFSNHQLILLSV